MSTEPSHAGSRNKLPFDMSVLVEAAKLEIPSDIRQRAPRYGRLGACVACKQPAQIHFDAAGRFVGCPNVAEGTVFVLVPIASEAQAVSTPATTRQFKIARYVPTEKATDPSLDLSDHRKRVLRAIVDAGESGALTRDVMQHAGLSSSSVSQALNWLRSQHLIEAFEASKPKQRR
jgi:hypothetical protein